MSGSKDPERSHDAYAPVRIIPLSYGYLIGADYLLNGRPVTKDELAEYLSGLGESNAEGR